MKLLNLGCGERYCKSSEWVNLDIVLTGAGVITHDLQNGIPFPDETFELVYHSHFFEHIPKSQVDFFIDECKRVLRPDGVLRVVVPDLEQITLNYIRCLEKGIAHPDSAEIAADYDWIMLEMYDQTVRNVPGGDMAKYFYREEIINESFVFSRVGREGKKIRENFLKSRESSEKSGYVYKPDTVLKSIFNPKFYWSKIIKIFFSREMKYFAENNKYIELGKFRLSGEIHQWMYDRYSLACLLIRHGLKEVIQRRPEESFIANWSSYYLDTEPDGSIYKPASLYMEAIKKL